MQYSAPSPDSLTTIHAWADLATHMKAGWTNDPKAYDTVHRTEVSDFVNSPLLKCLRVIVNGSPFYWKSKLMWTYLHRHLFHNWRMTYQTLVIRHYSMLETACRFVTLSTKLGYLANSVAHQHCQENTQRNMEFHKNTKIHCRGPLSSICRIAGLQTACINWQKVHERALKAQATVQCDRPEPSQTYCKRLLNSV